MSRRRGGTVAFFTGVSLATGLAFAAGLHVRDRLPYQIGQHHSALLAQAQASGPNGGTGTRLTEPVEEDTTFSPLETFLQVYRLVRENYVDKLPEDRKMTLGAVRAMVTELNDPNSRFLEPADRQALEGEGQGRFAGIGVALAIRDRKSDGVVEHKIVVVAPLPGSPAETAGIHPGDVVTHVDGKWILGSDPFIDYNRVFKRYQNRDASEDELDKAQQAVEARIRGGMTLTVAQRKMTVGEGEARTFTVQRPGAPAPLTFEMTTAVTQVTPLSVRTLPGGIGYIRVRAFTDKVGAGFRRALADLPKRPGLVLDLRGCPGGMLDPAIEMASALTRGGNLLFEVGPRSKRKAISAPASSRERRPVVLLVDRGTASSAEVLAAILRDKGIGTLVGTRTFGDSQVQTLYPLADGSAFTLTTGKLLTVNGSDWQGAGLTPKLALPEGSEDQVLAKAVAILKDRAQVAAAR